MGNLGAYQDIVIKAKGAGGVEKQIESIEKSAALKALPKSFAAGVAATIAAVAVVKQYTKRSEAYEVEADQAKAKLTDGFVAATGSDESELEEGADLGRTAEDRSDSEDGS